MAKSVQHFSNSGMHSLKFLRVELVEKNASAHNQFLLSWCRQSQSALGWMPFWSEFHWMPAPTSLTYKIVSECINSISLIPICDFHTSNIYPNADHKTVRPMTANGCVIVGIVVASNAWVPRFKYRPILLTNHANLMNIFLKWPSLAFVHFCLFNYFFQQMRMAI